MKVAKYLVFVSYENGGHSNGIFFSDGEVFNHINDLHCNAEENDEITIEETIEKYNLSELYMLSDLNVEFKDSTWATITKLHDSIAVHIPDDELKAIRDLVSYEVEVKDQHENDTTIIERLHTDLFLQEVSPNEARNMDCAIYQLHSDNTESMLNEDDQINDDLHYGYDWRKIK